MKKNIISPKAMLLTGLFLLAVGAATAYRVSISGQQKIRTVAIPEKGPVHGYDPARMDTLRAWAKMIDLNVLKGAMKGKLSIKQDGDIAGRDAVIDYTICRNGRDCYYRYGNTEMLNAEGVFLYIDHAQHKIILGRQKNLEAPEVVAPALLAGAMSGENYQLSGSRDGHIRTLRLLNPRHVSCMEYALSFDEAAGHVSRVYAHVRDAGADGAVSVTKTVDLRLSGYDPAARPGGYLQKKDVFFVEGGRQVPATKFNNYQLINVD